MTVDNTPPSPPGTKQRGIKIRRFVKRVTSFASIRPNGRDGKGPFDPKHPSESVPEHPSPPFHPHSGPHDTDDAHDHDIPDHIPGDSLPLPPSLNQTSSASSSATATSRTHQPTFLSPRRDDDNNSVRSGELSDSQESSFSGLSALPSEHAQSTAASPMQAGMPLLNTSLDHRLSFPAPPESAADIGARVDSSYVSAVDELARALNGPRVSITSELGVSHELLYSQGPRSVDPNRTPVPELPTINSLLLDVTSHSDDQLEHHTEDIPALDSLTQLDSEFGANNSSSILCPADDQSGTSRAMVPEVASGFTHDTKVSEVVSGFEPEEQDLPLPQEPTLPAIPEVSSGSDPDFLDLDTPAEGDVYAVGQPDVVDDAAAAGEPSLEEALVESFALAVPFESTAAEPEEKPASAEHDEEPTVAEHVEAPSVEDIADVPAEKSPTSEGSSAPSSPPGLHSGNELSSENVLLHADERPVIEAYPPSLLDTIVREQLPSSTPSEISIAAHEALEQVTDAPVVSENEEQTAATEPTEMPVEIPAITVSQPSAADEEPQAESSPVEAALVEPAEPAPVEAEPVESVPAEVAPVTAEVADEVETEEVPREEAAAEVSPALAVSTEAVPVEVASIEALAENVPVEAPALDTVEVAAVEEPVEEAPAVGQVVEEAAQVTEAPVEEVSPEAPAVNAAVEAPLEEVSAVEEASVEQAVAEEAPVEDHGIPTIEVLLERPSIEPCPPPELEALVREEMPSFASSETGTPLEDISIDHADKTLFEHLVEAHALEVAEIATSGSDSSSSASVAHESSEQVSQNIAEIATAELPEPCPPPEIDALIAADIPSSPISLISSGAITPLEESRSAEKAIVNGAEDLSGAVPPDETDVAVAAEVANLPTIVVPEDIATDETLSSAHADDDEEHEHSVEIFDVSDFTQASSAPEVEHSPAAATGLHMVDGENVDEVAEVDAHHSQPFEEADFALLIPIADHKDEQLVSEDHPAVDDSAVPAMASASFPVENVEDTKEVDLEADLQPTDTTGAAPEVLATPIQATNESAPADVEAAPEEDSSISITSAPESASDAHPPVYKDLPELIPSMPTSSNSSEYGDELEDPPYPATLVIPQDQKHLPLASRTVHLSLCYSLTWWLSKHPMF
ncbi:hypothetical protein NM688_g6349 [Phlebia brevispora]|uniref:Uncharacterized protein n=1 Tax=Phlebia brevispora TaxID=194682 RepID=A0ACC1SH48_9APHY|nr:hypothetical protein NM688_g6349 [Phlebia brevispora]